LSDRWEAFLSETVRRYSAPERDVGDTTATTPCHILENASCGDRVEIYDEGTTVRVRGRGCSICRASASIATEIARAVGRDREILAEIALAMLNILGTGETAGAPELPSDMIDEDMAERLRSFSLLADRPGRRRCAALTWEALAEWARRVDSR